MAEGGSKTRYLLDAQHMKLGVNLYTVRKASLLGLSYGMGILLSFFLVIPTVSAQVSGYLGKHVPISIEYQFVPRIGPFLQDNGPLTVNQRMSFRTGYIVQRNLSFSWSASRYSTLFGYESTLTNLTGEAHIRGWSTGPALRLFSYKRRGHMAPLGLFQQFELLYLRYEVEDLDSNYFPDQAPDLGTYQDLLPIYTIGYQRIIHPSLLLNGAFQAGWLLNSFRSAPIDLRPIRTGATDRLRGFFLFNISLGVGVILF